MGSPAYKTHMQHCHTQIPYLWAFQDIKTLVFGNKIITTSGTELFPVFFYILVLGDLDSNFLYYGQPFFGGVGD